MPPPPPTPHKTITITSSALTFGTLPNIRHSLSQPIKPFPTSPPGPRQSGTIQTQQPTSYNIPARNGPWNIFRLLNTTTNSITAYFASHSSITPHLEVSRILRLSGSPYEADSGSTFNNDTTAAGAVWVINRYDWGWYAQRSEDPDLDEVGEVPNARFEAVGIVDHGEARDAVQQWKTHRSSGRDVASGEGAAWLHIPGGEYMFGRFGFEENREEAVSFLFFTMNTQFTRTVFEGESVTLRKEETPGERFERRLAGGYDFSGLKELREMAGVPEGVDLAWAGRFNPPPPGEGERLGGYDVGMHILRAGEIDAIGWYQNANGVASRPAATFVEGIWAERVYDLINEMVLSYLERKVSPLATSQLDAAAMAEMLFPHHTEEGALDTWCYRHFMQPDASPIPGFDSTYVKERIASFLSQVGGGDYLALDDRCIAGITRALAYILDEILEMSYGYALDSHGTKERVKVMPSDIRMIVFRDKEFRDLFQLSRVFWEGRDGSATEITG